MGEFCVIGSGPAGVSAAVALTRRNLKVTMLDAGHTLEKSREQVVARLAASTPQGWSEADVRYVKEGIEPVSGGMPLKRSYGSDFPFRTDGSQLKFEYRNTGIHPGFARGGLSNVWGAGMLPFHPGDTTAWPFDLSELEEGYRGVLSFVPCSGASDDLEQLFPVYAPRLNSLPAGNQGKALLGDAARSQAALRADGIVVGNSRLAVHGAECRRCGMCLYGCPYELIYNAAFTLRQLRRLPNFRYEPGFVVERLREKDGSVLVEGHDLATLAPRRFEADRLLLGAGVVPSTAILLNSLADLDVRIRIQDSFYFLLPLLRFQSVPDPAREELHTLAQAFIVMRDPTISKPFVHFSIYGYNDLMAPSLRAVLGVFGRIPALVSRSMVAGGYLHSDLSPSLWMTLTPGRVLIEGEDSTRAIATAKKAAAKLLRQMTRLRTMPVTGAMRFPPPGRGFHSGGSFPISKQQVRHTSDIEGRPYGFERVHLVDASCLPSIPATPITLPVMANAWRIANLAAERA